MKYVEKVDDEAVKRLEEAFSIGADVSAACYFANISRTTYYNWTKSHPELDERFNSLRERPVMKAYKVAFDKLEEFNHAMEYLKRKRKDEFSDRNEHTGKDGEDLVFKVVNYGKEKRDNDTV